MPILPIDRDKMALSSADARAHLSKQLTLTAKQDRAAFRDVYVLTSEKLFCICLRICNDRPAAEDVLHDVYTIIWKRAGAYEPSLGNPISWMAAIARNRAIDWRRTQKRHGMVALDSAPDLPDIGADAEKAMLIDENHCQLFSCLAELDSFQRNAIHGAFFDGYTHAELAAQNSVPLGTMKSWIRRGLSKMRESMEQTNVAPRHCRISDLPTETWPIASKSQA